MKLRGDLAELEPGLGVEINPVFVSAAEWEGADADKIFGQIKTKPLVWVKRREQPPSPPLS